MRQPDHNIPKNPLISAVKCHDNLLNTRDQQKEIIKGLSKKISQFNKLIKNENFALKLAMRDGLPQLAREHKRTLVETSRRLNRLLTEESIANKKLTLANTILSQPEHKGLTNIDAVNINKRNVASLPLFNSVSVANNMTATLTNDQLAESTHRMKRC